jgi:hypothetical protein
VLSPEFLRKTAIETELIKRERKIDAVVMFWVLTLSFGVRLQRMLASLKRSYEKETNQSLSDSSWYYLFTPELVAFLKVCVLHGTEYLAQEQCYNLKPKLKRQILDVEVEVSFRRRGCTSNSEIDKIFSSSPNSKISSKVTPTGRSTGDSHRLKTGKSLRESAKGVVR